MEDLIIKKARRTTSNSKVNGKGKHKGEVRWEVALCLVHIGVKLKCYEVHGS